MIKVIAFDYAGVIEVAERNIITEITEYLHIPIENWNSVYYSLNHLCNTGEKTWKEVAVLTLEQLGATKEQIQDIEKIMISNGESKKINQGLIDIIRTFKPNYKIALVSNYPAYLREKLDKQNILDVFDEIVISGEVGYQKPQPEIFHILCQRLNIIPSEFIFIDDSKRSLEGAETIGYTPIHYKNNEQLEKDLAHILTS